MGDERVGFRRRERGLDHRDRAYRMPRGSWWRLDESSAPERRIVFWVVLCTVYVTLMCVALWLPPPTKWAGLLLLSPCGLLVVLAGVPLAYRAMSRSMSNVGRLLADRRCGACGYDLRGLEPEADGCCVCPECSAAWRLTPRCRTCGGHLSDEPLERLGWWRCASCGECWRDVNANGGGAERGRVVDDG